MKNFLCLCSVIAFSAVKAQSDEIDLGLLIIDSTKHHYYNPGLSDGYAHPKKESLEAFIEKYFSILSSHPKYEFSQVYTSVSFTVDKKGKLEDFILGDQPSKIDTLIVTTLFELGDWVPANGNIEQRFKLQIQSNDQLIFTIVDDPASFKGGKEMMYNYIYDHLEYPEEAKRRRVEGKVFIQFTVEKDGSLTDLKIVKGLGYGTDEEVLRLFKSMPSWKPASQRGRLVRQKFVEGVSFTL